MSLADECISRLQMVRMFEMYRDDNDQAEFKFLNVFTRIEACEKWIECRQALAKNKEAVYNPGTPVAGAAEGRPIGNKKAKAARDTVEEVCSRRSISASPMLRATPSQGEEV